MLKNILRTCLYSSLILPTFLFAAPAPTGCPSAEAIKVIPLGNFTDVEITTDKWYVWGQERHSFGTDYLWGFSLRNISADSRDAARNAAQKGIKTLAFQQGPTPWDHQHWACFYVTAEGYQGRAITFI